MKPLFTAAFKVDNRTFIEVPESIVKMTNIKDGDIYSPRVEPDGAIVLQRKEAEKG